MNLKFESVSESLEDGLNREISVSKEDENLAIVLEDAGSVVKDALENDKKDNTLNSSKEIIIKNDKDEKIAAIKINEVGTDVKDKNNEVKKEETIQEKSLVQSTNKEAGKLEKFVDKVEKLGFMGRIVGSVAKVGGTLIDSLAKKFLKDKYKINYSTYNNGKKALSAAIKKDAKTFLKKSMDVVLNLFKKVSPTTKMVFRNVKNKIVEEVFSLGKFLIAK